MFGDFPHKTVEAVALDRYVVKASTQGVFPYAVFAGNGEQQIYCGSKSDCLVVARRLTGAFLDGAFAGAGLLNRELTAGMQPIEAINWWIRAYTNPDNGPTYQGHGMLVEMLREYEKLRIILSRWEYNLKGAE